MHFIQFLHGALLSHGLETTDAPMRYGLTREVPEGGRSGTLRAMRNQGRIGRP
jgi:hypothetical protein